MISVLRNKHISNSGNVGIYLFRIGVFFLPSALTISILFLLVSSIINFLYQKKNFLNNWINKSFIAASSLMIFSAFVHLFNFNKGNSELLIMAKWEPTLSFVGLLNWIPLFWIFISLQAYVKDKEAREICAKCFILGVIPVIISGLGQSFFNWQDTSIFLNGLIIWYQEQYKIFMR